MKQEAYNKRIIKNIIKTVKFVVKNLTTYFITMMDITLR